MKKYLLVLGILGAMLIASLSGFAYGYKVAKEKSLIQQVVEKENSSSFIAYYKSPDWICINQSDMTYILSHPENLSKYNITVSLGNGYLTIQTPTWKFVGDIVKHGDKFCFDEGYMVSQKENPVKTWAYLFVRR